VSALPVVPVGVYVTEHEAVPVVVPATRVQGEPVNEPRVPASLVKLTVPLGVIDVPTSLSVTVAVHVVAVFTATDDGLQVIVVVVVLTILNEKPVRLPS
jgi:hypothetical protein